MSVATQKLPGSETIDLLFPADGGVESITMRRPKVRDLQAHDKAQGGPAEKELALFANLCMVAPNVLESLDIADYGALQEVYSGFLSSRKKTSGSDVSS